MVGGATAGEKVSQWRTWLANTWRTRWRPRLFQFAAHFTSFLPTCLIGGMVLMLAVPRPTIVDFLVYTFATIALEVCFTCLRAKYAQVSKLQRRVAQTRDEDARLALFEQLEEAASRRAQCWLFVGAVIFSWALVAVCEVGHMGQLKMPDDSKLYALGFSAFNIVVALYKMWALAGEDLSESMSGQQSEAEEEVNPVHESTLPAKG